MAKISALEVSLAGEVALNGENFGIGGLAGRRSCYEWRKFRHWRPRWQAKLLWMAKISALEASLAGEVAMNGENFGIGGLRSLP